MKEYRQKLQHAIAVRHGGDAIWTGTQYVQEEGGNKPGWEGDGEVFYLFKHPKAKSCYAWGVRGEGETGWTFTTVLAIPPIYSAQDAVRSVMAAQAT